MNFNFDMTLIQEWKTDHTVFHRDRDPQSLKIQENFMLSAEGLGAYRDSLADSSIQHMAARVKQLTVLLRKSFLGCLVSMGEAARGLT